ncbi:glycosyltransferase family 9 protein, partial [Glutamicibacter creatinolyticus]|uniref:glycosyltransferase family 9 protein n=1 Tax=Glutamicibacter creatinolyticus TaxID=162496 RepID=UPI003B98592C
MNETAVGPVAPPFESIGSIAVLRGGGLGDLLFAMPAIHALAATYPQARITLLGTPLHAELLAGRPGPVDEVAVLPFAEGVRPGGSGDTAADAQQVQDFLARMREREFDLAVQVHGGGRFSNPFLLELGAKHTVGTRTEDAAELERTIPYHYYQHEVLRALEVAGMAGATTTALTPRIEVTEHDRDEARTALEALARSLP